MHSPKENGADKGGDKWPYSLDHAAIVERPIIGIKVV
jgi:hypothetical protein